MNLDKRATWADRIESAVIWTLLLGMVITASWMAIDGALAVFR